MRKAAEQRNQLIQEQNTIGNRMAELQEEKNEIALFSARNDELSQEYFNLKRLLVLEMLRAAARQSGMLPPQ